MEGDFDGLFELATEDRSVSMLESIFGGIIALVETGTESEAAGTWINTAVNFFNLGCLLIVVLITLYTVLTLVFDTAKDGATFGQNTDTRYTMFRVIAGAIFFIPVSGGFSVAQVMLLWLVVQGSALADSAWNRIATNELDGNTFISPARVEQGIDDQIVRQEFARALDALVVGNLCAQTLNDIATTLTASDPDDAVIAVALAGASGSPEVNAARFSNTDTAIRNIYFTDVSDDGSYRSSNALCGGVSYEAPWAFTDEDPDTDAINTDFFRLAMTNAAQARMESYTETIVDLNGEAESIASLIRSGDVEADALHSIGLDAVDAARIAYISGARDATTDNITDEEISTLAGRLQDKVSADGWVMAAAWQRGISRAVADQRASFSDFQLDVTKESNVERFLRPRDWNGGFLTSRDPTTDALLSEMEISMEAWNTVAPRIAAESRGRASNTPSTLSSGGGEEMSGALGNLAELMIDVFSPRDGDGYSDPMVDITEYGFGLIKVGGLMVGAGAAADIASGVAMFTPARAAAPILDGLADHILYPVGWTLLMSGFVVSSLLPLIPIIYFLSAIASWLILVLESIFAVPLAVLSLFTPSREGSLIGSWNRILLSIFGIFLRPLLTIIGLFAGMLLIAVVLDFSYDLFRSMVVMVAPTPSILNIFTMLGVVIVSVIVSFYIVLIGSKLITEIGDGAMNWLAIPISSAGQGLNLGQAVTGRMGVESALPNRLSRIGGGGGGGSLPPPGGGGGVRPPAPSGGPAGGAPQAGSVRGALSSGDVSGARGALAANSAAHGRATRGGARDAAFRAGTSLATRGKGPK